MVDEKDFKIGDLVWAKAKWFPLWPAKIVKPPTTAKSSASKKTHYVFFFGTNNHAWIQGENIRHHSEEMLQTASKKKSTAFKLAMQQIVRESESAPKMAKFLVRGKDTPNKPPEVPTSSSKQRISKMKKKTAAKRRLCKNPTNKRSSHRRVSKNSDFSALSSNLPPVMGYNRVSVIQKTEDSENSPSLPGISSTEDFQFQPATSNLEFQPDIITYCEDSDLPPDFFLQFHMCQPDDLQPGCADSCFQPGFSNFNIHPEIASCDGIESQPGMSRCDDFESQPAVTECEDLLESQPAVTEWEGFENQPGGSGCEGYEGQPGVTGCEGLAIHPGPSNINLLPGISSHEGSESQPGTSLLMRKSSEATQQKNITATEKKIGFIGLGMMGQRLVKNLITSGHKVTLWNRTTGKYKDFILTGASIAQTPGDLVEKCDITFCCVSGPDVLKGLMFGNYGILSGLQRSPPGSKGFVEMTTIDPITSFETDKAIKNVGGKYLEAQISGSRQMAEEGTLLILCAGDRELYLDCESCLQTLSSAYPHSPHVGTGTSIKTMLSLLMGISHAALIEAMRLFDHYGIEKKDFLNILELGLFDSPLLTEKGQNVNNFFSENNRKYQQRDLNLVLSLSKIFKEPMVLTAVAKELLNAS